MPPSPAHGALPTYCSCMSYHAKTLTTCTPSRFMSLRLLRATCSTPQQPAHVLPQYNDYAITSLMLINNECMLIAPSCCPHALIPAEFLGRCFFVSCCAFSASCTLRCPLKLFYNRPVRLETEVSDRVLCLSYLPFLSAS